MPPTLKRERKREKRDIAAGITWEMLHDVDYSKTVRGWSHGYVSYVSCFLNRRHLSRIYILQLPANS